MFDFRTELGAIRSKKSLNKGATMAAELQSEKPGKSGEGIRRMDTHILAIDDDLSFLLFLKVGLQKICRLTTAHNLQEAQILLEANGIDIVLLDIGLGAECGLEALKKIKKKSPHLDVIMVSGRKDSKFIVEAVQRGASDYLVKPFDIDELVAILEKSRPLRMMRDRHAALVEKLNDTDTQMIGQSPALRAVLQKAAQVEGHKVGILIEGESGTGKELLARYIHRLENDPRRPFVAVNCAAIPENLLESELFGHEKGSFTGAFQRKIGKFELGNGGDIFLDEISSLKWDLQAKILRALQEREITRVGGNDAIRIDFRVITASNENLEALVEEGRFRRDLYHRLRVIALKVPPLRERKEDIPLLIDCFLKKHDRQGKKRFTLSAINVLQNSYWPGNIRELENLIQSLVILAPENEISRDDLPEWVFRKNGSIANLSPKDFLLPASEEEMVTLRHYVDKAERALIHRALEISKGDKTKAASLLDISRTRLYERLKLWGIQGGEDHL